MGGTLLNITYELWKREIPKEEWTSAVSNWISSDTARAKEILKLGRNSKEVPLSSTELRSLATNLARSEETLLFTNPLIEHGVNVFVENLTYLIRSNTRKRSKDLAKEFGVTPETISRWMNGKRMPTKLQQVRIKQAFLVPTLSNLEQDPLFLDFTYLGANEIKEWLKHSIDKSENEVIRELFPALQKLLG